MTTAAAMRSIVILACAVVLAGRAVQPAGWHGDAHYGDPLAAGTRTTDTGAMGMMIIYEGAFPTLGESVRRWRFDCANPNPAKFQNLGDLYTPVILTRTTASPPHSYRVECVGEAASCQNGLKTVNFVPIPGLCPGGATTGATNPRVFGIKFGLHDSSMNNRGVNFVWPHATVVINDPVTGDPVDGTPGPQDGIGIIMYGILVGGAPVTPPLAVPASNVLINSADWQMAKGDTVPLLPESSERAYAVQFYTEP